MNVSLGPNFLFQLVRKCHGTEPQPDREADTNDYVKLVGVSLVEVVCAVLVEQDLLCRLHVQV